MGTLGLVAAASLVLTGCGTDPDDAGTRASDFKGCIVSGDGGFQDRSFDQGAGEGLHAAEDHKGIQISQAESRSEKDFEPNLASMVQQGCNLTVSVGYLLADTTEKVAAAHPDKQFAIVDDNSITADNVKSIVYDTAQAAFLAGYLAAGASETGTVAAYGGMDIPTVTVFLDGFADGVTHYNEKNKADVQVLGWNKESQNGMFLGSFHDSSKAKSITQDLIDEGADVVLPVAGQAARGAVDAVTAANGGGKNVRLIWPDSDGYETLDSGRDFLLTSVLKDVSGAVEDVMTQAVDGGFDNTAYVGTLENGGVGLAPYHDQKDEVGQDLDEQLQQLKRDIIDGKITVRSENAPTA